MNAGLGSVSSSESPPRPAPAHGVKRRAGENNTGIHDQRLSKRFNLLNIGEHNSQLWTDPSNTRQPAQHKDTAPSMGMQVDDTKDRIYIHDLDKELELADDVADEDKVIFLPDIDKKLNRVPKHLLVPNTPPPLTGNEMVLYSVPSSLSVPEERDSVKKAILETRARASQKATQAALQNEQAVQASLSAQRPSSAPNGRGDMLSTTPGNNYLPGRLDKDEDAMDLE